MKWKLSKKDIKGFRLTNIHEENAECSRFGCVVHHWSKHHMRSWPLDWRDDAGKFERICEHGVGHDDPDAVAFQIRNGNELAGIHGCDGCCVNPKTSRLRSN